MDVRELVDRVLVIVDGNQAELARRLGRSETTISRWANGKNGIDYESALRIARMTGLPPRQVLESVGLDAELFPATESVLPNDPDIAEMVAFFSQVHPDQRPTVKAMVRAAANTSGDPTANHASPRVNGRRRGQQPPLKSHLGRRVAAYAAMLILPIWRPRPVLAMLTAAIA